MWAEGLGFKDFGVEGFEFRVGFRLSQVFCSCRNITDASPAMSTGLPTTPESKAPARNTTVSKRKTPQNTLKTESPITQTCLKRDRPIENYATLETRSLKPPYTSLKLQPFGKGDQLGEEDLPGG